MRRFYISYKEHVMMRIEHENIFQWAVSYGPGWRLYSKQENQLIEEGYQCGLKASALTVGKAAKG